MKTLNILFDIPIYREKENYLKLLFIYIQNLNKLEYKIKLNIWTLNNIEKMITIKDYLKLIKYLKKNNIKYSFKRLRLSNFEKKKIYKINNFLLFYYFILKASDKNIYTHIDLFFNKKIPYNIPAQYFYWRNKYKIQKEKKEYMNLKYSKIFISNLIHYRNINKFKKDKIIKILFNLKNTKNNINFIYKDLPKLIFNNFKKTRALYLMDHDPLKFNKEYYFHFDEYNIYKEYFNEYL